MLIFIVKWIVFRDFSQGTSRIPSTYCSIYALVAQLDRALACGAKGRRFESYRVYQEKITTLCGGFFLTIIAVRCEPKVRHAGVAVG